MLGDSCPEIQRKLQNNVEALTAVKGPQHSQERGTVLKGYLPHSLG